MERKIDSAAYETKLDEEVNIPAQKKQIDCRHSKFYWTTSIIKYIQWIPFLNFMDNTSDKIETQITLLPLLLKVFCNVEDASM